MDESNKEWCEKNCPYLPECGGGLCNVVLEALKNEPLPVLNVGSTEFIMGIAPLAERGSITKSRGFARTADRR